MLLDATESQLVLVDYQERLMPAIHEGPAVLANARRLAQMARLLKVPTFATEENPASLGATVPELQALITQAGGKTFPKMSFSAVADGLAELRRTQSAQAFAKAGPVCGGTQYGCAGRLRGACLPA
eukprot:gene20409-28894_t